MDNQKDNKIAYISAKTDKLAVAVYLVTAQLPAEEPIKWKLRQLALETISFKGLKIKNEMVKILDNLDDFLFLAMEGGSVSSMNFGILKAEYQSLKQYLDQATADNLKIGVFLPEPISLPALTEKEPVKEIIKELATLVVRKPNVSNGIFSSKDKELRQSLIMKYIKGQGWTAIKDIAKVIPDCSVKTVQRELAELVDRGLLKKTGDRRWSRYMLAP